MVLAVCTGVENLWIWIPFRDMIPLVPLIAKLPLKQLHAVAQPIFIQLQSDHPFFSQLTHLELEGGSTSWGEFGGNWSCLSLLPRQTHLAFGDWAFLRTCPELLRTCNSLSALILLEAVNNGYLHRHIHDGGLEQEPRFVVMQAPDYPIILRNWQIGAHHGVDFWMRADDFIHKRRCGEIDGAVLVIPRGFLHCSE
ncbi:hypothetical protein C8J57DRAFT_248821 [Mycena rebaudengoi]|nr:hypothetical protein C8J57DRAFT_248821 [Mycena rebaudengoi]